MTPCYWRQPQRKERGAEEWQPGYLLGFAQRDSATIVAMVSTKLGYVWPVDIGNLKMQWPVGDKR